MRDPRPRPRAGLPRLPLKHGAVPDIKLAALERLGKSLGVPLSELEASGRDETACDAFLARHGPRSTPPLARLPPGSQN